MIELYLNFSREIHSLAVQNWMESLYTVDHEFQITCIHVEKSEFSYIKSLTSSDI